MDHSKHWQNAEARCLSPTTGLLIINHIMRVPSVSRHIGHPRRNYVRAGETSWGSADVISLFSSSFWGKQMSLMEAYDQQAAQVGG